MNVLATAMNAISAVNPNQNIIIRKEINFIDENGLDVTLTNDTNAIAQIQKLTTQEAKDYSTYLETTIKYKFLILGDRVEIVNSLLDTSNTKIIWDNKEFNIFGKDNNQIAGWIRVFGAYNANVDNVG